MIYKKKEVELPGIKYAALTKKGDHLYCLCKEGGYLISLSDMSLSSYQGELLDEDEDTIFTIGKGSAGRLRHIDGYGNRIAIILPRCPKKRVIYMPHGLSYFTHPDQCMTLYEGEDVSVYGFGNDGHSIIIIHTNTITIYTIQ